ncbi:MAG: ABC transporter ATP-binding protein [Betaproteobacteria bacterium]|nr:ABC transporter ATP-binding protein [Betaproteobacteria bacterium]MDE2124783.1 ABC transporter ATP-binding protein [Betaproteobacteria bacterium]MDE2185790.1 ABC transporter ATP-binding protein [Betaproteobacteria bacterium]MDE2326157.1 ABC transporter ATP-binding protein [Betaproteobacteria bacterium]
MSAIPRATREASSQTDAALLRIEALNVDFGPQRVVHDLNLELRAGEKFALVGESGSGKTVTALAILRLLQGATVRGRVLFQGQDLASMPERRLRGVRGRDIAMIFQEPMSALNPLQPVGQQIAESLELHEALSRKAAWARAVVLLERMGIADSARRVQSYPHQLSGGQRQRAMIAMALACKPRLLLADEPTTALDMSVRAQILALLDELQREEGLAVMLISHDLHLVRGFAQRVGVMQQGRLVEQGATAEVFAHAQHPYTQALLGSLPQRDVEPLAPRAPIVLHAERVSVAYAQRGSWLRRRLHKVVDQVSLELRAGETLGLVGESGCGKTSLAMALLGLQPMGEGCVSLDGVELAGLDSHGWRAARRRIQVVFQDPFSSLSPRRNVEQIVAEGLNIHEPALDQAACRVRVVDTLRDMGLDASILPRFPHEFSGGQRQRIALARALVLHPSVLVLDEPTSALDISVQQQILHLLIRLQREQGLAYLFITHDMAVIGAMAHRIAVMREGKILETGEALALLHHPQQPYTRQLIQAAGVTSS